MVSPSTRRVIGAAGVLLLLLFTAHAQTAALARRAAFPAEGDALYLPRPSALAAMSLGHTELAADLVFLRAIAYFGSELAGTRNYQWLDNYLDTIVKLDPTWKMPYQWAGVATMYNGAKITNEAVMASSHFLALGVKQFPDDWNLSFMLGFNYFFELKTTDPAQKARWRRIGGEYVQRAALAGGAPSWVPLLAATIFEQEGEEEAAIRHLEQVYVTAQDPDVRQQVHNRLLSLHAKVDFDWISRAHERFTEEWQNTVPYASPDFFAVLGPAPGARLDWKSLAPGGPPAPALPFEPGQ